MGFLFTFFLLILVRKNLPLWKPGMPASPLKVCSLFAENECNQFIIVTSQVTANLQPSDQ